MYGPNQQERLFFPLHFVLPRVDTLFETAVLMYRLDYNLFHRFMNKNVVVALSLSST